MFSRLAGSTVLLFLIILSSFEALSQHQVKGKILNRSDGTPVPYASLVTRASRNSNIMSDTGGRYNFSYSRSLKETDSVIISAIGYKPLKMGMLQLVKNPVILLDENHNILENVIVVSTLKGHQSQFNYYRSWRETNTRGEIGQIIDLPTNKIQIGTVEVKVNKNYDTCWLKLHLRDVGPNGWPERELLKYDIIIPATVKNGLVEFDVKWESFNLPNNRLFVGFEVLKCSGANSDVPSFLFMGSEEGENYYRDKGIIRNNNPTNNKKKKKEIEIVEEEVEWHISKPYTIYIRMMIK